MIIVYSCNLFVTYFWFYYLNYFNFNHHLISHHIPTLDNMGMVNRPLVSPWNEAKAISGPSYTCQAAVFPLELFWEDTRFPMIHPDVRSMDSRVEGEP